MKTISINAEKRSRLYNELLNNGALIGIGIVSETEIDRLNILQASLLAMKKAVKTLDQEPDFLLVDGNQRAEGHDYYSLGNLEMSDDHRYAAIAMVVTSVYHLGYLIYLFVRDGRKIKLSMLPSPPAYSTTSSWTYCKIDSTFPSAPDLPIALNASSAPLFRARISS